MKLVFALILFCLLLLPVVGRGQGIVIDERGDERQRSNYEYEDRYAQSKKYTLQNAAIYTKQGVRKVDLFDNDRQLRFMICFDKEGKIISRLNSAKRGGYSIKTDSFFEQNRITVIDSFLNEKMAERIDTLVIDQIEIIKKNYKSIFYERMVFKSYKSGSYLNQRNDYYRNLLKYADDRYYARRYPNHGQFSPTKRIDGNFDPVDRLIYRRRAASYRPLLSRKTYQSNKLYLAQTKISYQNIPGDTTNKSFNLLAKNKTKFLVRGENFNEKNHGLLQTAVTHCYNGEYPRLTPVSKEKKLLNNKGLIDTIFTITYYEQAKDKPCVKPPDTQFTDYLRGYSGVPVKSIQYYYSYEHFDE